MVSAIEITPLVIRKATIRDLETLSSLAHRSLRHLAIKDYSREQVQGMVNFVERVDERLVEDGTMFLAQVGLQTVGCAAWSRRAALHGDSTGDGVLDPARDAAKIRNVFVDPRWARRGIARRLMQRCERAAFDAGFRRLELLSTLTGYRLYNSLAYKEREALNLEVAPGVTVQAIRMDKLLPAVSAPELPGVISHGNREPIRRFLSV